MKKPTAKPLRARTLDTKDLAAASGGRGIRYGYTECLSCGYIGWEQVNSCPSCGSAYWGGAGGVGGVMYQNETY